MHLLLYLALGLSGSFALTCCLGAFIAAGMGTQPSAGAVERIGARRHRAPLDRL